MDQGQEVNKEAKRRKNQKQNHRKEKVQSLAKIKGKHVSVTTFSKGKTERTRLGF